MLRLLFGAVLVLSACATAPQAISPTLEEKLMLLLLLVLK